MSDEETENGIQKEYDLWKSNCKFLYEFIKQTTVKYSSLTVQWLPNPEDDTLKTQNDVINGKLLFGTDSHGSGKDYLNIGSISWPRKGTEGRPGPDLGATEDAEVPTETPSVISIVKKLNVETEIHRARYMPQDDNIVASLLSTGVVKLFDLKILSEYASFDTGLENGYSLAWNQHDKGKLLTSLHEHGTALRDVSRLPGDNSIIYKAEAHSQVINEVSWHSFDANVFASVSDDDCMYLFDVRAAGKPVSSFRNVGCEGIHTLSFSPFSRNLVAMGGINSEINLVDLRLLSLSGEGNGLLHSMVGHEDPITCLEFSPHHDGVLASGAEDRKVNIWDLSKIGEEQDPDDAEDGSPELVMMHAGHTASITDISWCPYSEWVMATLAEDNSVHVWKMKQLVVIDPIVADEDVMLE